MERFNGFIRSRKTAQFPARDKLPKDSSSVTDRQLYPVLYP